MKGLLIKGLLLKGLLFKGLLLKGLLLKGLLHSWSIRVFLSLVRKKITWNSSFDSVSLPKNNKVTYVLQSHLCDQRFFKKCQKMPVLGPLLSLHMYFNICT